MTAQTRAVLKGNFEQGDKPQGSDYADLIDSFLSLTDTTAQTVTSDLIVTNLIGTTVSADSVNASAMSVSVVSAATVLAGVATINQVNASSAHSSLVSGAAVRAGTVSAGTVQANAVLLGVQTTVAAVTGAGGRVPVSAEGFLTITLVSGGAAVSRRIPYFLP